MEVIFCIRLLLHQKTFKVKKRGCSPLYPLAVYCEKWPKMTMFMGPGSRKEYCHSHKTFFHNCFDPKTMPFKFGNNIFINLEMPRSSYNRPSWKINISFLFRPFALEVLDYIHCTTVVNTLPKN